MDGASIGRLEVARAHIAAATEIADATGDVRPAGALLLLLAYVVSHHGDFVAAMALTDRSSALYEALERPWDQAANSWGAARAGLEKLQDAGIGDGALSPFEALVRSGHANAVAKTLAKVEGVRSAAAPAEWRRDETAILTVIPTADGNSAAGRATLDRIHAASLPGNVTIGGDAALSAEFLDAVYGKFPLILALISVLTSCSSRARSARSSSR